MVVYHVKNSMWRRRVPAAAFSRRHLHQLSRASVANRDLLCACTSAGGSQPARRFSEAILKSTPVSAVTEALTQNELVFTVQDKLIAFHELSGLPWWATIVASTTAVRALLFPLAVHQQRVMAEWGAVHRQMETGAEAQIAAASAQLAKSERWDAETADSNYQCAIYDHRQELYRAHGCQPWKALVLPAVQLPVWVAMSAALHNIASMLPIRDAVAAQAYADMKATAVPLLADLTATDETAALALVVVVAQLLVIQLRDKIAFDQNPYRRTAFVVWRGATLGTYPFLILAPKCVTLYWLTSSLLAVLQNVLFVRTRTRQLLRIPSTERTNKDPFERLIHRLKSIYYFFRY